MNHYPKMAIPWPLYSTPLHGLSGVFLTQEITKTYSEPELQQPMPTHRIKKNIIVVRIQQFSTNYSSLKYKWISVCSINDETIYPVATPM